MTILLSLVGALDHYLKFPKIWIDNSVFRLHAKVSVLLLFGSCTIITFSQYFGSPIDCVVAGGKIPQGVMNTYCWIHSTFILPKNISMEIGTVAAHPGVGSYMDADERVENKYYQWVCFTLFFQGLMFLIPYELWKNWEGGKVVSLIPAGLTHRIRDQRMPLFATPIGLNGLTEKKITAAVKIMKEDILVKGPILEHRYFLHKFAFCELLNFINVIFQICFLDYFLGGMFSTYGSDVLAISEMDPDKRIDPMDRVFPKVAKCSFHKFGASGTIETADGLCVLSLNIINEKIYIVLWFWFVFLATVSGIQLAWRLATIFSRSVRESFLRKKSQMTSPDNISTVCDNLTLGDWFILILLSENIDSRVFAELISQMAKFLRCVRDASDSTISTAV